MTHPTYQSLFRPELPTRRDTLPTLLPKESLISKTTSGMLLNPSPRDPLDVVDPGISAFGACVMLSIPRLGGLCLIGRMLMVSRAVGFVGLNEGLS